MGVDAFDNFCRDLDVKTQPAEHHASSSNIICTDKLYYFKAFRGLGPQSLEVVQLILASSSSTVVCSDILSLRLRISSVPKYL